jgi:hypothetical protein
MKTCVTRNLNHPTRTDTDEDLYRRAVFPR